MQGKKVGIDPIQVEQLAARFWKNTEIAAFFNCSESLIKHKYAQYVIKGREQGKGKLRDAQLAAAFKGSAAMLIWLGKQYLEQSEKVEVKNLKMIEETFVIPTNGGGKDVNRLMKYINQ